MTAVPSTWGRYSISITIDAGLVGQILQYGFANTTTYYQGAGVFYDNVKFSRFVPTTGVVEPKALNTRSHAPWVTASIELTGFDPMYIEIASLRLAGLPADAKYAVVGDRDGDMVPDLTVRFSYQALLPLLPVPCGGAWRSTRRSRTWSTTSPPFPFARESLEKISGWADVIVCSATPGEALRREWAEHGIARHALVIAGQEMGSKAEHLRLAIDGRQHDHVVMLGDAPGDRKAAEANGVRFYPINPGAEDRSWQRFLEEIAERFRSGSYDPELQASLVGEFERLLPECPPWQATGESR